MKCQNCGSNHSVSVYTLTITNLGAFIEMTLCVACRVQFQTSMWRGEGQAA